MHERRIYNIYFKFHTNLFVAKIVGYIKCLFQFYLFFSC